MTESEELKAIVVHFFKELTELRGEVLASRTVGAAVLDYLLRTAPRNAQMLNEIRSSCRRTLALAPIPDGTDSDHHARIVRQAQVRVDRLFENLARRHKISLHPIDA